MAQIARGERVQHFETVRRSKSGRLVDISVTVSPINISGRVVGASKIARDITGRKQTEQELRTTKQQLQLLVGRLDFAREDAASRRFGGRRVANSTGNFSARFFATANLVPLGSPSNRVRTCVTETSRNFTFFLPAHATIFQCKVLMRAARRVSDGHQDCAFRLKLQTTGAVVQCQLLVLLKM